MKGHVLAMKLDTNAVVQQLPLATESVPFRVIISPSYTEAQRTHALKQYVVRPQQLRQMLAWAKAHNPYFKDVTINEALLASLPESSVPTSIVRVSELADLQSPPPKSKAKSRSIPSALTSFFVQTRVLDTLEKQAANEAKDAKTSPPPESAPNTDSSASSPSSSAQSTPSSQAPVPDEVHTADALNDDTVHYNAMLRVAAPVVDTSAFLREAVASAPTFPTSPQRPSASASSSSSSSSLTDSQSNACAALTVPASASSSSSSSSASMLTFPPAAGAAAASASRALYHVQTTTPVWENEKDWFERAFCLNGFPFGRGGPTEYRRTHVSRGDCLAHYMKLALGRFQSFEYVLHAYDVQARTKMASSAFAQAKIPVFATASAPPSAVRPAPAVRPAAATTSSARSPFELMVPELQGNVSAAQAYGRMSVRELELAADYHERLQRASRCGANVPLPPRTNTAFASQFIRSVKAAVGAAQHTTEYAQKARTKDFAFCNAYGKATYWYDGSCCFGVAWLFANMILVILQAHNLARRCELCAHS